MEAPFVNTPFLNLSVNVDVALEGDSTVTSEELNPSAEPIIKSAEVVLKTRPAGEPSTVTLSMYSSDGPK